MIDPATIRACSFDCYGTLIDWQTGILGAIRPRLAARSVTMSDAEILRRYAILEAAAEEPGEGGHRAYREVLETVAAGFLPDPSDDERTCLWRSLPDWPAFPDTAPSLARLKQRYAIIIASNIDDDLFAHSRPKLGVDPDHIITAQQVRSYKPGRPHFDEILRRTGLAPHQVLHVGESRRHDVEPAKALGFRTAWVDRAGSAGGGASASGEPRDSAIRADVIVQTLEELAGSLAG